MKRKRESLKLLPEIKLQEISNELYAVKSFLDRIEKELQEKNARNGAFMDNIDEEYQRVKHHGDEIIKRLDATSREIKDDLNKLSADIEGLNDNKSRFCSCSII